MKPYDPMPCDYCSIPMAKYTQRAIISVQRDKVDFVCEHCYYKSMKTKKERSYGKL